MLFCNRITRNFFSFYFFCTELASLVTKTVSTLTYNGTTKAQLVR